MSIPIPTCTGTWLLVQSFSRTRNTWFSSWMESAGGVAAAVVYFSPGEGDDGLDDLTRDANKIVKLHYAIMYTYFTTKLLINPKDKT